VHGDVPNQRGNVVVNLGGRSTPIFEDGYYLTANHLVSDATPLMPLPPAEEAE